MPTRAYPVTTHSKNPSNIRPLIFDCTYELNVRIIKGQSTRLNHQELYTQHTDPLPHL
jgi:hypothetical protein